MEAHRDPACIRLRSESFKKDPDCGKVQFDASNAHSTAVRVLAAKNAPPRPTINDQNGISIIESQSTANSLRLTPVQKKQDLQR
jgi:hypothetical protein